MQSEAEINLQFDLEGAVVEMQPYIIRVVGEGAAVKERFAMRPDLKYGEGADDRLDLYLPAVTPAPLFFFIHGGWWRSQSKEMHAGFARGMLERGFAVAMPEYTLCPSGTIPTITDQTRRALSWLYREANNLSILRDRFIVAGHSAGGQQTAMACLPGWTARYGLPPNLVKGAIPISGLFDLRPFRFSWLQPALQLDAASVEQESAIDHISEGMPPQIVTLGGHESLGFHQQSTDYVGRVRRKGNECETFDQPGRNHFTALYDLFSGNSALTSRIVSFAQVCFEHSETTP